jgi:hypothetical protein
MDIFKIFDSLLNKEKELDLKKLPSMGIFYKDDFSIKIRKTNKIDIKKYTDNFEKNVIVILNNIKILVNNSITLPQTYTINDIKSIDIMYIFFKIVEYTTGNDIPIIHKGNRIGLIENFYNFEIPEECNKYYNKEDRQFVIDDWRFSLPCIGIEKCVTEFLLKKDIVGQSIFYTGLNWNFMYFLSNKSYLSDDEIENLLTIFSKELSDEDKKITNDIIEKFSGFMKYKIKYGNELISIDNNIELHYIFS